MRVISRIAAVPFAIIVVVFAIANRGPVEVSFDPLPFTFDPPLYLVALGALVAGFAAGAGAAWLSGYGARRQVLGAKAHMAALEAEVARLREARAEPASRQHLPPSADAA